jgi:ATP-dependent DNA helicase RecQ
MTDLHQLLHDRFGFSHFRGVQQGVVERTVAGESSLTVMPTGAGKSLCYQLPSLVRRGTGIVISPLIALMEDQVRSAEANGISAAALTSASTDPGDWGGVRAAAGGERDCAVRDRRGALRERMGA